jgi:hypothetical protein
LGFKQVFSLVKYDFDKEGIHALCIRLAMTVFLFAYFAAKGQLKSKAQKNCSFTNKHVITKLIL